MNSKVSSREIFSKFATLSVDKYSIVDLLQIGFCKYIPTWPSFALCPGGSNEAPMATESPWVPSSTIEFHRQLKLRHFWSQYSDESKVIWEPFVVINL